MLYPRLFRLRVAPNNGRFYEVLLSDVLAAVDNGRPKYSETIERA